MTNNGEIGTASKKEKRHILEKQIQIKKSQTHNGERETQSKKVRTRQKRGQERIRKGERGKRTIDKAKERKG